MGQMGFYFDMTACTGCKSCQVACKDANDLPIGSFYREARDFEGGTFPNMWAATLSMGCNHCDDPICAKNCPTGALRKDSETGLVIQDHDACIGCQMCVWSCPYGAPTYNEEQGKSGKCDGCKTKFLDKGMQPACAGACTTRALRFGEIAELISQYGDNATSDLSILPPSEMTHPNFLVKPKEELK